MRAHLTVFKEKDKTSRGLTLIVENTSGLICQSKHSYSFYSQITYHNGTGALQEYLTCGTAKIKYTAAPKLCWQSFTNTAHCINRISLSKMSRIISSLLFVDLGNYLQLKAALSQRVCLANIIYSGQT